MKNSVRYATMFLVLAVLSACASLGVPVPQTFNERLAAGYVSVTGVRQTGTVLVTSGKLTVKDAENVQKQADNVREGLDVAQTLHANAPLDAEAKLDSAVAMLNVLKTYVNSKK